MRVIEQVSEDLYEGSVYAGDISYIPHLNIVFSFISKNASTSLKTMLSRRLGPEAGYKLSPDPHMASHTGFQNIHTLGPVAMEELLLDSSVPKVTLVREPFERLQSAYFSRVHLWQHNEFRGDNSGRQGVKLLGPIAGSLLGMHSGSIRDAAQASLTFEELVDYVCETPTGRLDRHLAPQVRLVAADRLRYDLIGRFEELPKFWTDLKGLLGVGFEDAELIRRNATQRQVPMKSIGKLRSRVEARYSADYEIFSYRTGEST